MVKIEEALPRPLGRAFRSTLNTPKEYRPGDKPLGVNDSSYGYGRKGSPKPIIDFDKSEYTEISPEEAIQLYKNGNSRNVIAVFGDQVANRFWENDVDKGKKVKYYDFKAERNYSNKDKFQKSDGSYADNSNKLTPTELYTNADHIFVITNEVPYDPNNPDILKRRENPESKYVDRSFGLKKPGLRQVMVKLSSPTSGLTSYKDSLDRFRLNPDGTVTVNSIYDYSRDSELGKYYDSPCQATADVDGWESIYKRFLGRWGGEDSDTLKAYTAYLLAKDGEFPAGSVDPFEAKKDIYKWKDHKANIRNKSVRQALQEPFEKYKEVRDKLKGLERKKDSSNQQINDLTSSRPGREQQLQANINNIRDRLMRVLQELEKYETQLEDIDITDQMEIDRLTQQITDIDNEINQLRGYSTNFGPGSIYGKKFPLKDSLEETGNEILESMGITDESREEKSISLLESLY